MKNNEVDGLKKKKVDLKKEKLRRKYRNLYWAKYIHLNTKARPMIFKNREFLTDIYKAVHTERKVCITKSVQCGVSECFVVSHLEQAERGLAVLYILPKVDLRHRFVLNRVNKMITMVPHYRQIIANTRMRSQSISLKMFGKGVINYVASNSPANFTEFPADVVYYDEKDRMDQANILLAKDRLSESKYKFERIVGNPTISEYGISEDFESSTKGERFFKCPHCGEWQEYDFFNNVVKEIGKREYEIFDKGYIKDKMDRDVNVYCKKCMKIVDRLNEKSQWVHENLNSEMVGFHINKIFSPQGTIKELVDTLLKAKNSEYKFQIFLNSDLGLPMVGGGSQITRDELISSRGDYLIKGVIDKVGVRFAGVDVGNNLHTIVREIVNGRKKLIFKGKLKSEYDVLKLIRDYNIKILVIDAEPEMRMVENLKNVSSKIYNCFFGRIKETGVNKKDKIITIRRTLLLDRVKENYDRCVYINPSNILDDREYEKHMYANVRIADMDAGEFMWVQKSSRADHYLLAEGYCDMASDLAIGVDIFKAYRDEIDKVDKIDVIDSKTKIVDEIDDLSDKEKNRIEEKKSMTANEFFNKLHDYSY